MDTKLLVIFVLLCHNIVTNVCYRSSSFAAKTRSDNFVVSVAGLGHQQTSTMYEHLYHCGLILIRVLHGTGFSVPLPSRSRKHLSQSRPAPVKLSPTPVALNPILVLFPMPRFPFPSGFPIPYSHFLPQNELTESVFSSLT